MHRLMLFFLVPLAIGCSDSSGPAAIHVGQDSSQAAVFARVSTWVWGSAQTPSDTIGVWNLGGFLRIQGSAPMMGGTSYLTLDLGFSGTGPYPQNYPLASTAYFSRVPASGLVDSILAYQAMQGRFSILSYNSTTKYLEGTFEFQATKTGGPGPIDQIAILNGVFRGFIRIQ